MRKIMKGKFAWLIVVAVVVVSALFVAFVGGGNGANSDMREITKATTNFTQTITK